MPLKSAAVRSSPRKWYRPTTTEYSDPRELASPTAMRHSGFGLAKSIQFFGQASRSRLLVFTTTPFGLQANTTQYLWAPPSLPRRVGSPPAGGGGAQGLPASRQDQ